MSLRLEFGQLEAAEERVAAGRELAHCESLVHAFVFICVTAVATAFVASVCMPAFIGVALAVAASAPRAKDTNAAPTTRPFKDLCVLGARSASSSFGMVLYFVMMPRARQLAPGVRRAQHWLSALSGFSRLARQNSIERVTAQTRAPYA